MAVAGLSISRQNRVSFLKVQLADALTTVRIARKVRCIIDPLRELLCATSLLTLEKFAINLQFGSRPHPLPS